MREKLLNAIVKFCANLVLDHIGTAVVYCVKLATDAVEESAKAQKIIAVAEQVSTHASKVASVMKDGAVTEAEEAQLKADTEACANSIKELL